MDEVKQALALGNNATSLLNKLAGPWSQSRQATIDATATIQKTLADRISAHIEAHPNDHEVLDAIATYGGKVNLVNLARILQAAQLKLNEGARPDLIGDDWFANFKEKARTCSDPDFAELWAELLANEANHTGSYSRKAVNTLADMDKSDAELFRNFCRFLLMTADGSPPIPVILEPIGHIYVEHGVTNDGLRRLDGLGLIRHIGKGNRLSMSTYVHSSFLAYSNGIVAFSPTESGGRTPQVEVGAVSFTPVGMEMLNLCLPIRTPDGFVDWLVEQWSSKSNEFAVTNRVGMLRARIGQEIAEVRPDLGRIWFTPIANP